MVFLAGSSWLSLFRSSIAAIVVLIARSFVVVRRDDSGLFLRLALDVAGRHDDLDASVLDWALVFSSLTPRKRSQQKVVESPGFFFSPPEDRRPSSPTRQASLYFEESLCCISYKRRNARTYVSSFKKIFLDFDFLFLLREKSGMSVFFCCAVIEGIIIIIGRSDDERGTT